MNTIATSISSAAPSDGGAGQITADRQVRTLRRRRLAVLALNGATVAALALVMALLLAHDGLGAVEVAMGLAYLVTLPWLSIGFWNAVLGTILMARGAPHDDPLALVEDPEAPITSRTAVVMTVRNEDPEAALGRLRLVQDDLSATGLGPHVDVHVLSDTSDPAIALAEENLVAAWRAARPDAPVHYRRRADNAGYKAGNLEEFCARRGADYDYLLPLDADSLMSAELVARLVRLMERHPRIGILQTLAVGTPSRSLFTRAFQFGMRHGMRAYTAGSVWWTGDCGPYWGHNALIRVAPFAEHCRLPVLPGDGPLGGHVMSHDQVEAVLMRRAGYHVRVLAEEGGSYEDNPPTLPDFIRRELRWCRGNMQYFKLLAMPGLHAVSRVQLALAILMYLAAPAWMAFVLLGALATIAGGVSVPAGLGVALVVVVLTLSFAPKLMGLAGVLANGAEAARYGGRGRALAGGLVELVLSMLMAPAVAFAVAVFAVGLLFGVTADWRAQPRSARRVGWGEAARTFLPQAGFGIALVAILSITAPHVLWFAAPVIAGLVLAAPFAVLTADPRVGTAVTRLGVCAIPEEADPPPLLARLAAAAFATAPAPSEGRGAEAPPVAQAQVTPCRRW
ncbi:glucans biosynthesis glucosyltransferase MdoH [Acuticoccus sp.]|uniref:glucans biosynthesis glucosyltransferase MdoH n=1 Tax=Acuticoccus sp. TaxID=1904378 RepID=UPI003B523387